MSQSGERTACVRHRVTRPDTLRKQAGLSEIDGVARRGSNAWLNASPRAAIAFGVLLAMRLQHSTVPYGRKCCDGNEGVVSEA